MGCKKLRFKNALIALALLLSLLFFFSISALGLQAGEGVTESVYSNATDNISLSFRQFVLESLESIEDLETVTGDVYGESAAIFGMTADTSCVTEIGDQFTLEVNLSNAQNVGAIAYTISFDPTVLKVIRNEKGNSITENTEIYDTLYIPRIDTQSSLRIDGVSKVRDFGANPVWLGRIKFEILREAKTQVTFTYHKLSTPPPPPPGLPQPIPHQGQGCELIFDFTPPSAQDLYLSGGTLAGGKVPVEAIGNDDAGLSCFRLDYSLDAAVWNKIGEGQPVLDQSESTWKADCEWDTGGLSPGSYYIRVVFRDYGGKEAELEKNVVLTGGSIRGEVLLEGLPSGADRRGIEVSLKGTGQETHTDSSGHYLLQGMPAGDYFLVAGKNGFLGQSAAASVTLDNPDAICQAITLPAGDITGDNLVDLDDLIVMLQDYDTAESRSDLDRSGLVDIRDLFLLDRNYSKSGAQ
jgi:hypothetical protein